MTFDDVTKREQTISGALALAMHLLLFVLLVVGVSWQPKRTAAPVMVELWSELPPAPRSKPEPLSPPEPLKQAPRPPPRPEPKPELKPVPKPDIALKEKLIKERKQKEEREKAEVDRRQKELEKKALEKERQLKEQAEAKRKEKEKEAEQKKREDEKKRLAALKKKEDAQRREQEMQEMLRKQAKQQAEQAAKGRLDAYSRLVGDKIKRYIVEPPNLQGKPEAVFEVVQIPGGEIMSVTLKRSSGNPAYDAAAERAIRKAQPLPPPPDPARFGEVRELQLIIRPEGK